MKFFSGLHSLAPLHGALVTCRSLEQLVVSHNELRVLPGDVLRAVSGTLRELDISFNQVELLPADIGSCVRLQRLSLRANRLHTLPNEFAQLSELYFLDLSDNEFEEWPESLSGHSMRREMQTLLLAFNQITALPQLMLSTLPFLTYLSVRGNPLSDLWQRLDDPVDLLRHLKTLAEPCRSKEEKEGVYVRVLFLGREAAGDFFFVFLKKEKNSI